MKINRSQSVFILQLFCLSTMLSIHSTLDAQKPKAGDWLTEVGISMPFGGQNNQYFYNSNVSYSNYYNNYNYYNQNALQTVGLNTRYYKTANKVYRTRLSFGGNTNEYPRWSYNGAELLSFREKSKTAAISFGIEKHFNTSSNKFSPFHLLGASLGVYAYRSKHLTDTLNSAAATWWNNNGWIGYDAYTSKANSLNVGLLYLFGFDYWITSDMYIGMEYGVNFNYQYSGGRDLTLLKVNNLKIESRTEQVHKPFSTFNISNFASPYIRFGWRFYKSPRSGG